MVSVQGICPSGGCGGRQAPENFLFSLGLAAKPPAPVKKDSFGGACPRQTTPVNGYI